ncbi:DUF4344 domain-containing metallopeptidase [Streptomyces sp. NPDC093586]|uniref:DUF4344 domain-containing metallopeptidase n=1 Tax=Streptomyces sp. NPDC093586 TaxID=3366042 RepID=UPI00381CECFD
MTSRGEVRGSGWAMRSAGRVGACLGWLVPMAAAGVSGCQKPDPSRTGTEGSGIVIHYGTPADSDREGAAFLRGRKVAEEATSAIGALVDVDRPMSVGVVSCDGEGSSCDPEATRVKVCYDEVSGTRELFRRTGPRRSDDAVAAVMLETLFHEMAHALVDVLELPVHGREEDAADQFAALMLLRKGAVGEQQVLAAAEAWQLSEATNEDADEGPGTHSSDGRRAADHRCYVYGAASGRHRGLVGPDTLPDERAKGCAEEWNAARASWMTALASHLRDGWTLP